MANTAQSKKRARQAEAHRARNTSARSTYRTYIKHVLKAIIAKDQKGAEVAYQAAVPILDRMARKKIISKNKAARHKSRLIHRIRALSAIAS